MVINDAYNYMYNINTLYLFSYHLFSYHSPSVNFNTQSAPLEGVKVPGRGALADRSLRICSMSVLN